MAETDQKTISELDYYGDIFNEYTIIPFVVNYDSHNRTRKVYFDAMKTQIVGYELVGTLNAGDETIALSSTGTTYASNTNYAVGSRVTNNSKNYICIKEVTTSSNWETDGSSFVEYPLLTTDSTVDIYTDTFGVNPTSVSIADNAITLTFSAQSANVGVKVRVS